ncbi:MAG: DUF2892 domain-containing protein [Alphaproteobacteria bacterium]|nr:DUF2892 domain-containing protein [Alphaproteobacteria bacterium]
MTIDQAVMRMAGIFNLIGLALAYFFSPYWLLLSAFVGLNLIQASFTGFCPAVYIFKKIGIKFGPAFNP